MIISEERLEQALRYLATTDAECAALRADVERSEFKAKRTKEAVFQIADGTVAERNAIATTSQETQKAYDEYFECLKGYHAIANKRSTESIVIECWRSMNANRRQAS